MKSAVLTIAYRIGQTGRNARKSHRRIQRKTAAHSS
jgi:hypothetical protein